MSLLQKRQLLIQNVFCQPSFDPLKIYLKNQRSSRDDKISTENKAEWEKTYDSFKQYASDVTTTIPMKRLYFEENGTSSQDVVTCLTTLDQTKSFLLFRFVYFSPFHTTVAKDSSREVVKPQSFVKSWLWPLKRKLKYKLKFKTISQPFFLAAFRNRFSGKQSMIVNQYIVLAHRTSACISINFTLHF